MSEKPKAQWLKVLAGIVYECFAALPDNLDRHPLADVELVKSDGDPAIRAELLIEDIATRTLSALGLPITLYSEERGYLLRSKAARAIILLDPIDGTFFLLRGLPGACIALSAHDPASMAPIASLVGDYCSKDIYWATAEGAFRNGARLQPSSVKRLQDAYVATCYGKASRIDSMLKRRGFAGPAMWMDTCGTMLAMARVGSGQVDAYFDLMLGYKPYDFAPAAFIAEMAGAVVTDEKGSPLRYPKDLNQRCKFVVAATQELHRDIMNSADRWQRTPEEGAARTGL